MILSLFPGIGLLDRAFEEEGFCVVRGPDVLWGGDIRTFNPRAGAFDGVIGGPPCQTFSSLANLVRAKGHEPRFGNLIPEFERVTAAAAPRWFLMENVPTAPLPQIPGYQVSSFVLDNCVLDSGDGYGEQQERKRRFSFGLRGDTTPPSLLRFIQPAALLLPRAGVVSQTHVDNSPEAKGRTAGVVQYDVRAWPRRGATREQCALDGRPVPAAHGGSGKPKRTRTTAVTGSDGGGTLRALEDQPRRARHVAVTAAHPKGGHLIVYRWHRMLELQGLPPDFLNDAPFTVEGKRKAVANGVPLPMGCAIAQAVRRAIASAT